MINLLKRNRQRSADNGATGQDQSRDEATPRSTPPSLSRTHSDETLLSASWAIDVDMTNYATGSAVHALATSISNSSLMTTVSTADTVVDLVLGHSFTEFNLLRTLPVVSFLFKKGVFIFPSEESLAMFMSKSSDLAMMKKKGLAMPVLQMTVPMMSAFKRSYPAVVFHRLLAPTDDSQESQKIAYCQVFVKYLKEGNTTRHILKFSPNGVPSDPRNFQVVMFSSSHSSLTDCIFRETKLRWVGTTPMSSNRGSGFFKLVVLGSEIPSLVDGINPADPDPRPCLRDGLPVLRDAYSTELPPVTRFSDKSSKTVPSKGLLQLGDVKLIEVFDGSDSNNIQDIPDCSLVLLCMSLVMRDDEIRKNHGNARCYDSSLPGTLFY